MVINDKQNLYKLFNPQDNRLIQINRAIKFEQFDVSIIAIWALEFLSIRFP